MKLKIFMIACASAFIVSFPQNIIGCGPDADPYDYYTSFFSQRLASVKAFSPFYYTSYNFLYSETEPLIPADVLAKEWSTYAGVKEKDARAFVTEYAYKDINNLYYNIEKAQPLKIPDSVKANGMSTYFMQSKDLEALGYILYAKQVQPFVSGDYNTWEPIQRDSLKMVKLIKNGQQLYAVAKKEEFKLKYAYQIIRLAHYSKHFADAIRYYDEYIPQNKTQSVLQQLCLALKAGALYRMGQQKEAAYLFSKVFIETDVNKISNYISFFWSVDYKVDRKEYVAMGKTNEEKAAVLALFALGSGNDETAALKEIYKFQPNMPVLEVLATREINKLEEKYFTPMLNRQKGGKEFYYTWNDSKNDSTMQVEEAHLKSLTNFFATVAKNNNSSNTGLFQTAAAYTSFMVRDYVAAKQYLAAAKKTDLTAKVQDQWALTNLLVTINEQDKIDAGFEAQILPSIKWLQKKAIEDTTMKFGYYDNSQWKIFYRNLMSEIIAKRYHAQGDLDKEVLAIGNAENIYNGNDYNYNALDYLRNHLLSGNVEKLYNLMSAKNNSAYDSYLIKNNSLKVADVIDFAGTAYLRDYKYAEAITWFNKSSATTKKYSIEKNPFIELLYDQEEKFGNEKLTTKLAFTQEMLRLQKLVETDKVNAAKNLYKMALGMYNMTYYGHAWELVQYYRSGSDGYYIPKDATAFQKEYYGCYAAHDYFKKAMDATADKNFKAKCLFMMAKCDQKVVRQPQYSDFGYDSYDKYEAASKVYFPKFKYNRYFPKLVKEYAGTAFYKEALSSCSYLSDFVRKK